MRAKRLGRGLSGLISKTTEEQTEATPAAAERRAMGEPEPEPQAEAPRKGDGVLRVAPAEIARNPYQPRTRFESTELAQLKDSIREYGILQPLVVRRSPAGLELVAGERRLRAALDLELEAVPVVVRDATDEEMQTLALVENLQRVDLNAIEKARAMRAMMQNFGLTQEEAAARVGKARATIANLLRLLELPEIIQEMVEERRLGGAQARAILQVKGEAARLALARDAIKRGYSVRKIEEIARRRSRPETSSKDSAPNPYVADVEDRLTRSLGARVKLRMRRRGGSIEVQFANNDELDRLIEALETKQNTNI
ncbi:MAG: ParB/RepB/Spo0J family partition protein [Planctomycetota bacterium]|nr:ParB/RepB/Spo0J family partition protein [Planctomycetota bacterium]